MTTAYTQDGVNVVEGDSFSAFAGKVCQSTYGNSKYVFVDDMSKGNFRGPRGFILQGVPQRCRATLAPDGIGTKVVIIDAAGLHRNASRDLLAMSASDITRWGGQPLVFTNVLDLATLGQLGDNVNAACRQLLVGLGTAAGELGLVVLNGETAELGSCVSSENPEALVKFNWAGVTFGVYDPNRMIRGDTLKAGQAIIALRERGFRSNGISSVRKALRIRFGETWWDNPQALEAIQAAVEPSVFYDNLLLEANGWQDSRLEVKIPVHLIVHVTGGAIKSKLAEDILFPLGLSARLDDLYEPPAIMRQCAEWREMPEDQLYETWNGGQGELVVVDQENVGAFVDMAQRHDIEAKRCGTIMETQGSKPEVTIISKFQTGREIVFRPAE